MLKKPTKQSKLRYGILLIFFGLILSAQTPVLSQGITLSDDPLEGRRIFETKGCIICHSVHGIGGEVGPDLGKDPNIQGIIEITTAMWNHSPQMTEEMRKSYLPRPTFTMGEIEQLYSFLYYLRYLQTEGNEERGKRIFKQKGCMECHSMESAQSRIGPDLRNVSFFVSPLFLIQAIWNHGEQMAELMDELQISRPELSENDLQDIASYLRKINKTQQQQLKYVTPGNPAEGEKVFIEKKCALCHNLTDRTVSIGPDLREADYDQNVSYIGAVLWNHAPQMWEMMKENDIEIPELVNREAADLVSFIYFLKFLEVSGSAQDGKSVFEKKGCITCHMVAGEGGDTGPPVSGMSDIKSSLEFSRLIWNHAPQMEQYMNNSNLPWPEFTDTEMADIYTFLHVLTREKK